MILEKNILYNQIPSPPLWENRRRFPFEHGVSRCFVCCQRPQYFYKKQIPPPDKARYASVRSCKYYTNPLQILYKYYTNTIQILYKYHKFKYQYPVTVPKTTLKLKYNEKTVQIPQRQGQIRRTAVIDYTNPVQILYKYHIYKYQ